MLSGCHALTENKQAAPPAEEKPVTGRNFTFDYDFDGARVHGSGRYRYRMRLEPRQPYALSHEDINLPFVAEEKDVFQGITDSEGRTDVFAFEQPVDPQGWNLRLRVGEGAYGEQFVFTDQSGNPIAGFNYALLVCGTPRACTEGSPTPSAKPPMPPRLSSKNFLFIRKMKNRKP